MKQIIKRCLSAVLCFAMIFTMMPASAANVVKAEGETGAETASVTTQIIKVDKIAAANQPGDNPAHTYICATSTDSTNATTAQMGNNESAAYENGMTATSTTGLGSARQVGLAFDVSEGVNIDANKILNATLKIRINKVHSNLEDNSWTKAGLFSVDSARYTTMSGDNENTFPAKNAEGGTNPDYSRAATVYSNESVVNTDTEKELTFDVTDWIKAAIVDDESYAIFRMQPVTAAFYIYSEDFEGKEFAPRLSITTGTNQEAVNQAKEDLKIPSIIRSIPLPTVGTFGSAITWTSDNEQVTVSEDGKVSRPQKDTQVTLTATIERGPGLVTDGGEKASATKEFQVTVKAAEKNLLAEYVFEDGYVDGRTIQDASGNGKNAELKGTGASIENGILTLPGGEKTSTTAPYVDIPGDVFASQDTVTVTMWLKNETGTGNYAAAYFGQDTDNYWLLNPCKTDHVKSVWKHTKKGEFGESSDLKSNADWAMYTTVITSDKIAAYYNGVKAANHPTDKTGVTSTWNNLTAYIGRSCWTDPFYKGGVYDYKVYGAALSAQDIWDVYYADMPAGVDRDAVIEAALKEEGSALDETMADIDLSTVTDNLTLPDKGTKGSSITWESNNAAITNDGKVTRPGDEEDNAQVRLTATIRIGDKTITKNYDVTVLSTGLIGQFSVIVKNFTIDTSVVTGNFELPTTIEEVNKGTIAVDWESSNETAVKIEKAENKITGKVTRLDDNVKVPLTAKITWMVSGDDGQEDKKFEKSKGFAVIVRSVTPVLDTAITTYDFNDFSVKAGKTDKLTDGAEENAREITLESVGNGKKPELKKDEIRGQVLSLTEQQYTNRGDALLPGNPFAGKSIDNGLTLNFWTQTTGTVGGDRCLIDFEVAPAEGTGRAGTFAVNQSMTYWNTTDQGGANRYSDMNTSKMNLAKGSWKMVTMTITKDEIAFYSDGEKITHTASGGSANDYENMIKDLVGNGEINQEPATTNVRIGASLATYWHCAGALMDEVSFFDKALSAEEIITLYNETALPFVVLEGVTVTSEDEVNTVGVEGTLQLSASLSNGKSPKKVTWASDNTGVLTVDDTGLVTGVAQGTANVTATVSGIVSEPFEIEVIDPDQAAFDAFMRNFTFDVKFVKEDLTLPNTLDEEGKTTIVWTSDKTGVIKIETAENGAVTGKVTVPEKNTDVTLTAAVTYKNGSKTLTGEKKFTVIVLPEKVKDSAIATYDFKDFSVKEGESDIITDGDREVKLESAGSGKKPELKEDTLRGQVLSLTEQNYADRGFALLPGNPFAGKSIDSGLTLNFWTNSTTDQSNRGNRNLIDFEVAPAEGTRRAGTFAVNQSMVYWNTTDQGGADRYSDMNTNKMNLAKGSWKMVTMTITKDAIAFYSDGEKITHSANGGSATDYENMIKDLVGNGEINQDPTTTNVRIGASLATYWHCAGALMDDVSFYDRALSAEEVGTLYEETKAIPLTSVTISGKNSVGTGAAIQLTATLEPEDTTVNKTVTWVSSNPGVLTVDNTGLVTGVSQGTANVTATVAGISSEAFTITVVSKSDAEWNDLDEAIRAAKEAKQTDYSAENWAALQSKLTAAEAVWAKKPNAESAEIITATNELNAALAAILSAADEEWTALDNIIKAGNAAKKADYTEANWTTLQSKLKAAKAVQAKKPNAGSTEVTTATNELKTALEAIGTEPETYNKEQADKLAEDADKLLEGKNEYEYDEKVWADMQTALAEVKALTAESTSEEITAAYNKLKAAMEAFQPKEINSETLTALATDTKKELEGLNKADYAPAAWAEVEAALKAVEDLPADATEEQIKAAYERLWTAVRTLKASPFVAVDKVTLSKSSLTLAVKKTATLTATIDPSNSTDQEKQWKSSNAKIAKVDQNGKVTAVAKGTANITVTVGGKSATCKVTVTVPVTKVKITESLVGGTKPAVAKGKKITLKATITPNNASNKKVKWSIDKKSAKYASINSKGVLSAKKAGAGKTVTVTATAQDGSKKKATIKVKIMKDAVTKITLKAGKKKVKAGRKITVKATVKSKKASKTLAWSIDKKSAKYASINSKGVLSTKKNGKGKTVTVTATATDGTKKKATIKIKITK